MEQRKSRFAYVVITEASKRSIIEDLKRYSNNEDTNTSTTIVLDPDTIRAARKKRDELSVAAASAAGTKADEKALLKRRRYSTAATGTKAEADGGSVFNKDIGLLSVDDPNPAPDSSPSSSAGTEAEAD